MSRPLKDMMARALRRRYEGVDSALLIDLTGLGGTDTNRMRRELKAKDIRMEVVKNSVARRAFADGPLAPLTTALRGPCALVTGGESITDTARELAALARQYAQITLKEAIVESDDQLIEVARLAKMLGRKELLGELAMLIGSPGRALAGCLRGPGGRIAGCLQARIDQAA